MEYLCLELLIQENFNSVDIMGDELSRKSLTNAKTDVWIKSFNTDLILNFLDLGINNNGRRQTPHTTRHS